MKSIVRALVALFFAFFGALYVQVYACRPGVLGQSWSEWLCRKQGLPPALLLIPVLFVALIFLLGKRFLAFRRPVSVVLLLTYAIYGIRDAIDWEVWWLALVPTSALLAAVGILLRKAWGRILICALSVLFAGYYVWSIGAAVHSGYLTTVRPLQAVLSLVPGIAFGLAAGFCCYVVIKERSTETGGGVTTT